MKRLTYLPLAASLFVAASAASYAAPSAEASYLDARQIPLGVLLAPPAADGSERQQADLDAVLNAQRSRTPEQVARAKADATKSVFRFADVLGPDFNEAGLPKTAALFEAVDHDAERVAKGGKHFFSRARPFIASRDVQPIVPKRPGDDYNSYPSGHATFGYLCAILLAQMVPEKRDALFARGREFGMNRVVDGVHYPSDVEAGRIDGTLVAAALMANPDFQRDFADAKAEVRAALKLD